MSGLATGSMRAGCRAQCRSSARSLRAAAAASTSAAGLRRAWGQRPVRRKGGVAFSMLGEGGELKAGVEEGTKVKVTGEVTVYHAPKIPELKLQGMEGTVRAVVRNFKGKELSANLPYRVEFQLAQNEGKQAKLLAHLDASEFEVIS